MSTRDNPTSKASRKARAEGSHKPKAHVRFLMSDEQYQQIAQRQRAYAFALAAKIEAGEPLDEHGRYRAAFMVREFAQRIPVRQPGKRGQRPRFCHGSEALVFVMQRVSGGKPSVIYAEIADRVGVSEQAVEKAMRKHAPSAARLLEGMGIQGIPDNLFRD